MITKFGNLEIVSNSKQESSDICGRYIYFSYKVYLDENLILEGSGSDHPGSAGGPVSIEDLYMSILKELFELHVDHTYNNYD